MKGITLIETLVYIALLAILMAGIIPSSYAIIRSEEKKSWRMQESDALLLREIYHE